MTEHYLGRDPSVYDTCSDDLKRQVIKDVLANLAEGVSYESACWAADISPEAFSQWKNDDPRLMKAWRRQIALQERELVRMMRGKPDEKTGEKPSAAEMKMAHEALKQTQRAWMPRQAAAGLGEGLLELEKSLPAPVYALVVSTLHKHLDA